MQPPPAEVRAELERILAADVFLKAGHLSRLLRYVVDRALAGQGDQLEEDVLGVEVFDRGDGYDPRLDSIVRDEARRLRATLDEYYQGPGADDPIVISLARGGYAAEFTAREPAPAPVAEPAAAALPGASLTRWVVLAAISAALVIVALTDRRSVPADTPAPPPTKALVRIAVLPFTSLSTDPNIEMIAARVTDGITTELARLGTLSVVSRTSAAQFVSEQRPVPEVAQILGADLVMEGSAVVEGGQLKVAARLVDGALDRKVWGGEYQSAPTEIETLQTRIASEASQWAVKKKDEM